MKFRNIITSVLAIATIAAASLQFPASLTTHAAADGGFSEAQIEASPIKPTLSVSKIDVKAADAPSSVQTVNITINGADKNYSSTGFHVYFDERLTLVPNQWGGAATKGAGVTMLSSESYSKGNCLFLTTAGSRNLGRDGVMWSFDVKLPADAKDGDIYPIKLAYEKGSITEDVFINAPSEKDSRLMQAWIFTKGMQDGYIKVGDSLAGDANCDGIVDLSDAVLIMQCVSNPARFNITGSDSGHITSEGCKNGDVANVGDGITSKDALAIQKFMLRLIPSLPEN
ncbi:MAG: hypothetical protein J6M07_08140 [Ruminococcus sp.]|nr:hypothetical protein [Ruminococcus sp.]